MKELFEALAKAQGEFVGVTKDKTGSITATQTYKYADLAACLEVVRKPLSTNGLAVVQLISQRTDEAKMPWVVVKTIITHASGQQLECGELAMQPQRPGPQAIGACITYARRYSLAAALGLAQEDDDAHSAEGPPPQQSKPTEHKRLVASPKHIRSMEYLEESDSHEEATRRYHELDAATQTGLKTFFGERLEALKERFHGTSDHQVHGGKDDGEAKPDAEKAAKSGG
jgi:hypothetical protein